MRARVNLCGLCTPQVSQLEISANAALVEYGRERSTAASAAAAVADAAAATAEMFEGKLSEARSALAARENELIALQKRVRVPTDLK